jgi:hypothetical protein
MPSGKVASTCSIALVAASGREDAVAELLGHDQVLLGPQRQGRLMAAPPFGGRPGRLLRPTRWHRFSLSPPVAVCGVEHRRGSPDWRATGRPEQGSPGELARWPGAESSGWSAGFELKVQIEIKPNLNSELLF